MGKDGEIASVPNSASYKESKQNDQVHPSASEDFDSSNFIQAANTEKQRIKHNANSTQEERSTQGDVPSSQSIPKEAQQDSAVMNDELAVDGEVRSIIEHVRRFSISQETSERSKGGSKTELDTATHDDSGKEIREESKPSDSHPEPHSPHLESRLSPTASDSPSSSRATNLTAQLHQNFLPPDPEPEVRFNFHLFLEQLRHRTADPVARYLRSFLVEFGKKQWSIQEQVRIVSDFLSFISGKMAQCEVWRQSSDAEFDNAREGMEKLVMNRLYAQTFSPEIPPPPSGSGERGRRRPQKQPLEIRRGQHQEDIERDNVLSEKMQIFNWVQEDHLDVQPVDADGKRFLALAQQELLKINNYRAPRDKVICILNACKVIFGLLRSSRNKDTSADSFLPFLVYTVLKARPNHMVSNIQYIFRFRSQDKLNGEAGYYLSSLMGAVQFIETLDRTALTISNEDFERNVESAVAAIAERRSKADQSKQNSPQAMLTPNKATQQLDSRSPSRLRLDEADGPVSGLIKNIQRPLTNLGRMFSDDPQTTADTLAQQSSIAQSASGATIAASQPEGQSTRQQNSSNRGQLATDVDVDSVVETLSSMFPSLDRDVISDIVIAKQARIGAAVDACLSMTS